MNLQETAKYWVYRIPVLNRLMTPRYPYKINPGQLYALMQLIESSRSRGGALAEIGRVLKPGGWFCARTPVRWGYIGIGARAVPNSLHVRFLERLQPERKAEDVFPVTYRMNSLTALRKAFPPEKWRHYTYGFNGDPGYHANSRVLFRLVETWGWLMPRHLSAKFHVFLQKR